MFRNLKYLFVCSATNFSLRNNLFLLPRQQQCENCIPKKLRHCNQVETQCDNATQRSRLSHLQYSSRRKCRLVKIKCLYKIVLNFCLVISFQILKSIVQHILNMTILAKVMICKQYIHIPNIFVKKVFFLLFGKG